MRIKGKCVCQYRTIDKYGKAIDFMFSEHWNKAAVKFFSRVLEVTGFPSKIVLDKCGADTAGIKAVNKMLKCFGCSFLIEMVRSKFLSNVIEQDHRYI